MKKLLSVLLALAMVLALVPSAILAEARMNAPTYNLAINTPQELLDFCAQLNAGTTQYINANVVLNNDINMSTLGSYTFVTGPFNGIFYGNGHIISFLDSDVGGLFSLLDTGAGVENLMITRATITNSTTVDPPEYVGAIANESWGVIKDCYVVNSTISADCNAVGGLVGCICSGLSLDRQLHYTTQDRSDFNISQNATELADACVVNCSVSNVDVTNTRNALLYNTSPQTSIAGGVAGRTDAGFLENCDYIGGTVTGLRVGGILGFAQAGTLIRFCQNEGTVVQNLDLHNTAVDYEEAGMTSVSNLLAFMSIEHIIQEYELCAGGILGGDPNRSNRSDLGTGEGYVGDRETTIVNCMNYGNVKGAGNVGGIAGLITNPYFLMANCGNDHQRAVYNEQDDKWMIEELFSTIAGYYSVGGLVGYYSGGYLAHGEYAAVGGDDHAPDSVIYNSYNAMLFSQNTDLVFEEIINDTGYEMRVTRVYDHALLGGLVGTIDNKATLENCHNAGYAFHYDEEDPWIADIYGTGNVGVFGSLIGDVQGKFFCTHCFGCVKLEDPYRNKLFGKETVSFSGTALSQTKDTEAYVLDTADIPPANHGSGSGSGGSVYVDPVVGPFDPNPNANLVAVSDPNRTLYPTNALGDPCTVCGGVIIPYALADANGVVYSTAAVGALTGTRMVMKELQTYQTTYLVTNQLREGHRLSLTVDFLPWVCLEGTHGSGFRQYCNHYAVFFNGTSGRQRNYITPKFPDPPSGNFKPVLPPGVVIVDPDPHDDEALKPGNADSGINHSLTLDGEIGVNFYIDVPYASSEAYADFNFGNSSIQVPIDLSKYITDENNVKKYKFSCKVNSSQTSVQITGVVHNHVVLPDNGIDGWYESDPFTYSVNEYLEAVANNSYYQSQTNLMNLMRAISVYGFYANEFLHTDPDFVQSVLFDDGDLDTITVDSLAEYQESIEEYGNVISYYGSSLMLTSETCIRHYFSVDASQLNGHTLEEYTFLWEGPDGDVALTPIQNGNYYYVEIPNIQSGKLGTVQTVRVYQPVDDPDTDPLVEKWCYSGMSYALKVLTTAQQGGNVSNELVHVAQALGIYYNCAKAYFG